jgi:replicative DNA helicase
VSADESPRHSELAVLGCVLIGGGEVLDRIDLSVDDFLATSHARIFEAMLAMHAEGVPIDRFLLADRLPKLTGEIEAAAAAVWSPESAEFYADQVAQGALQRRVAQAGDTIRELAHATPVETLADGARTALDQAIGNAQRARLSRMHERFGAMLDRLDLQVEYVPTPWPEVDSLLSGGMSPGRFYVIGARPGMGKSAIALQLAHELSLRGTVLFSSLEMGEAEVTYRLWAQQARIPLRHILRNEMTPEMLARLMRWRVQDPQSIAVDDTSSVSVWDIRNQARSLAREGRLAGVVVDYLQLMTDPRDLPRHEKVAEMTRGLKQLSRELDTVVIACSQLNRESTRRADGRPTLADLRESGSIEQDADVVILLDRDTDQRPDPVTQRGADLVIAVAKNRQGDLGAALTEWQGEFVRARDWSNRA